MSPTTLITLILWTALFAFIAYIALNYYRIRKAATFISNEEFQTMMRNGQIIDVREPGEFHVKHILGARNIPASQIAESHAALRKDKPVLLYDNSRGQAVGRVALDLKKANYTQVYILQVGFEAWDGKTK